MIDKAARGVGISSHETVETDITQSGEPGLTDACKGEESGERDEGKYSRDEDEETATTTRMTVAVGIIALTGNSRSSLLAEEERVGGGSAGVYGYGGRRHDDDGNRSLLFYTGVTPQPHHSLWRHK